MLSGDLTNGPGITDLEVSGLRRRDGREQPSVGFEIADGWTQKSGKPAPLWPTISKGRRFVFLAALYRAEREIAEKLKTLAAGSRPGPTIDLDKAIPWVEQRTKLALADSQKAALRVALVSNVTVITGGPGVGKTTLVNSLLKILVAKAVTIALCAPTGRAAKRLSESTGPEAKTIHRQLETDPRAGTFRRNQDEPLDCDLLVVDETSMVDVPLMRAVLRALPERGPHRAQCAPASTPALPHLIKI